MMKMALAETIYEIWHDRNNTIFNGYSFDSNIADKVIFIVKTRCGLCSGTRKLNIHVNVYN